MSIIKRKTKISKDVESESSPSLAIAYATKRAASKKMARGGMVSASDEARPMSMAEAIRRKRMADGGMVDDHVGDDHGEEGAEAVLDELNEEAAMRGDYDAPEIHQPEDSNEHGDEDERPRSITDMIRSRMLSKRK